jgi:hypothetical protein
MQTVITLCDLCGDGSTRGEPVVIALGDGATPRVVDLCAHHGEDLLGTLRTVLAEHGRRLAGVTGAPAPPRSGDTYPCIVCGFASVSTSALALHLRGQHDLSGVADVYGQAPRCFVCAEGFDSARSLARHPRLHGEQGAHGLYRAALAAGDPHDLIAKRRAELGTALG